MSYKMKVPTEDVAPYVNRQTEAELIRQADIMRGEALAQLAGRVAAFVRKLRANIAETFEQSRTMRELAKLDDRELADIGISRGDIPAFAMGARRAESAKSVEDVKVPAEQPRIAA